MASATCGHEDELGLSHAERLKLCIRAIFVAAPKVFAPDNVPGGRAVVGFLSYSKSFTKSGSKSGSKTATAENDRPKQPAEPRVHWRWRYGLG